MSKNRIGRKSEKKNEFTYRKSFRRNSELNICFSNFDTLKFWYFILSIVVIDQSV
jgi:hypothetical protein